MTGTLPRGRVFSSRPFYTAIFLFSLLAVYSIFIRGPLPSQHQQPSLVTRSGESCNLVHNARDKCAFVKANCMDDEAGLLSYLTLYYCDLGNVQPVAFILLVLWLGLLFSTIGIAASDFFSVNLSTIATILGLSESLAGVTFLAFGNGSPDVFSTFAAMSSNSGSMAVGELIGAAGFITSVVAGSMALVREFKVSKKTFIRDICFFIAAVAFAMVFLADGTLHLWECCGMIGFYLFYVIVVVGWHAISKRRSARRAKEAASRGHFYASASAQENDELEPYRDLLDEEDSTPIGRGPAATDISVLERGPRIETGVAAQNRDDDSDHVHHVAAEVASSMRVNRPRGKRTATTISAIRPSLVGALEFRSVLSSLQREGNVHMRPIHARSQSSDRLGGGKPSLARSGKSAQTVQGLTGTSRSRALSSGAVPVAMDDDLSPRPSMEDRPAAFSSHTVAGKLAPPPNDLLSGRETPVVEENAPLTLSTPVLHRLQTPDMPAGEMSSPALSAFPHYTDSPMAFASNGQKPPSLMLPTPAQEHEPPFPNLEEHVDPKPVKWWPYHHLPAPHVLRNTLFPTLQGWREKSLWDKFLSIISLPSIFLLVITLPVVESETTNDDCDDCDVAITEQPTSGHVGNTAAPVSVEPNAHIESETEWQRYRRSTRSRGSSHSRSSTLVPVVTPTETCQIMPNLPDPPFPFIEIPPPKPVSERGPDSSTLQEEDQGWNRWLLILQIFTGPLFCVFIVWANMAEDLDRPTKDLLQAILCSLVFSLVVLGVILMTTSPDRRPKYHFMCCFLGFVIAIAWISTVAGEVVGILKAFGVILDISEAILGLTVFAMGNSVGDLVADITVARLGYPVMALSACFGGPLLNILLGIGLGGAFQTIQAANKHRAKHPDQPIHYKAYHIQVNGTLIISAITLMLTLLALLIIVPMNKWVMNRKIGFGLIALWTATTVANVVIEATGTWKAVA
ncbi:hypothetical protein F5Y15DRAFT_360230 [Xylariaceae sp. FL0016]|nr:hypothetical protein F5Y15DRAFT_360230 [Xylariaceae sp. FL0016]